MPEIAPKLCSVCAEIDFEKLFYPVNTSPSATPTVHADTYLGTLDEILQRASNCDVCQLIIDVHRQRYKRAPWGMSANYARNFESTTLDGSSEIHDEVKAHGLRLTEEDEPIKCYLERQMFACKERVGNELVNRISIKLEPCPWVAIMASTVILQAIWPDAICDSIVSKEEGQDSLTIAGTGRKIGPLLDLSLIEGWVRQCEDHHGDKCAKPNWLSDSINEWPENGRVIDIKERRVVDLLPNMRYVALSYVWGSSEEAIKLRSQRQLTGENLSRLQQHNGLDELLLPQTVQDAMCVTEKAGENFLWVDALCIVQDDCEELASQTSRMDLIYSKALFTILAAYGEDADSGLAGLPGNPRDVFQRPVKVSSGGLHITPCVTLIEDDTLQFSQWNTRGWTFQERILSRRSLIFTSCQVYWCCDGITWDEESLLDLPGSDAVGWSHAFGCNDEWDDGHAKFSFDGFDNYITQFSERNFTYASDALPAFLGIVRRFEHLNNEKLHWGLHTSMFEQALTWQFGTDRRREAYTYVTENSTMRSVPYPSWSWLGWTGFIGSFSTHRIRSYKRREKEPMVSLLRFYSLMSDGSVASISGNSSNRHGDSLEGATEPREPENRFKWMGETTVTGPIDMTDLLLSGLKSLQIAGDEEAHQQDAVPYDTGRIIFWTSHTEISIQIGNYGGAIYMETSEGPVQLELGLTFAFAQKYIERYHESNPIGEDASSEEGKTIRHTINLILISRHYKYENDEDGVIKLNIMAVEEEVPGSGVWGRVGIGKVNEEVWNKLDLDWRMVILE